MDNFWFFLEQGFKHILDWNAYDHLLFLVVLTIPYTLQHWRKLIALITLFTIGHTLSLSLSAFEVVTVNMSVIEFLIPLTILMTAAFNIIQLRKKRPHQKQWMHWISTFAFGIIHGFGFSTLFKMMTASATHKTSLLIAYTLGIELAQIGIVIVALVLSFFVISLLRFSSRDWVIIVSAIVIGIVLPILMTTASALSI